MTELMNINAKHDLVRVPSPTKIISIDEILNNPNRNYYAQQQLFEAGESVNHRKLLNEHLITNNAERQRYTNSEPESISWDATRIVTIEGLQTYGSAGILGTPGNMIIKESADILPRPAVHKHLIDAASIIEGSKFSPAPQYIDAEAIVILYPYGSFGHDFAQRFMSLGCFSGFNIDMVYCRNDSPFMQEAFEYLNIPSGRILSPLPNHFLRFRKAHFILRNDWNGPIPQVKRRFIDYLIERSGAVGTKPWRKVFYLRDPQSKSLVNHRHIRNRNEVVRLLHDKGFEEIVWEKLRITEKIKLIKEIKFAVEEFSSSSLYYVYFSKGCKLLSILGPEFGNDYYAFDPDFIKNNKFGVFRGINPQFAPGLPGVHNSANYEVDIDELEFMLNEMEKHDFHELPLETT